MGRWPSWWPFALKRTYAPLVEELRQALSRSAREYRELRDEWAVNEQYMLTMQRMYADWCAETCGHVPVKRLGPEVASGSWAFPVFVGEPVHEKGPVPFDPVRRNAVEVEQVELHRFGVSVGIPKGTPPERVVDAVCRVLTESFRDRLLVHYRDQSALLKEPGP